MYHKPQPAIGVSSQTWDEKELSQVSFWEEAHGRIPRKIKFTFYFSHPKHLILRQSREEQSPLSWQRQEEGKQTKLKAAGDN